MRKKILIVLILSAVSALSLGANPEVTFHITGAVTGDIVIELYPVQAPVTVANFIDYVQTGFYDGLIFHRVIEGFMIQGGGYDESYNYRIPNAPIKNESTNGLSNLRGTIAMARTSQPHSATSQFFINQVDNSSGNTTNLDYGQNVYDQYLTVGYCVFGQVISGIEVVDAIAAVATTDDVPDVNVVIQSAVITQNGPVCVERLDGDINGDCTVNLTDLAALTENWLACNAINTDCN